MAGHFHAPDTIPARVRWRPWIITGAVAASVALVATLAVIWPGFDAQQTPRESAAVWALQSGEGKRYARVNTELGELDTIKDVENPSGIAQTADHLFVFADGNQRFAEINPALPASLAGDAADLFEATPPDTASVQTSGDRILYLTAAGEVHTARLSDGGAATPIDPFADVEVAEGEERPKFRASAAALAPNGTVVMYSTAEASIVLADADTAEIRSSETLEVDAGETPQITLVGSTWALLNPTTGELWLEGTEASIETGAEAGARLQAASRGRDALYIADANGLVEVHTSTLDATRITDGTVTGTPTMPMPTPDGAEMMAAWLATSGGTLWTSEEGVRPLDYGGEELDEEAVAEFQSNGSRGILNETRSGWVWTVPDGRLLPSSQAWDLDERIPQQLEDVETQRVIDPKPPVAEPDTFGVRAGRDVVLPVLLNDHDPNEDILSVVPGSLEGLPESFGVVRVANNAQHIVVSVSPEASGSAMFRYQVTDGTSADGLTSGSATVTLNVVPDDVNTAPEWCGVDGCLSEWPAPEVAPGGTVSVETLGGWVDPEGDPIYLAGSTVDADAGAVLTTPEGTVTYQHYDPNESESRTVSIDLTVSDARGATASRMLAVQVTPAPELTLDPIAVNGVTGQPVAVDLRAQLTGVTGVPRLTAATPLDETQGETTVNSLGLGFTFTAERPGSYPVQVTIADEAGEVTEVVRITLQDPADAEISTVPLTAFVRPSEDATIDVLPAVSNPGGLVLLVSELLPVAEEHASLSVDVIGQQHIRVSGSTDDGEPGTLGRGTYTVSDGTGDARRTATGEITFVLLPAADSTPPIAVDDRVTVRAGAQVDIPVLENDRAPAGSQIAIDPSKVVNEHDAGLAFATSQQIRYLAPDEPGTYSVSYTIFRLGFPSMTDTARVHITVRGAEENTAPSPRTLEGRALSGTTVSIPFDRSAVDTDGDITVLDRVVSQPEFGSARISAEGDALIYTSDYGAKGQDRFLYQVRDELGETGIGEVRVGILDEQSDPSPITYSDYVQVQIGETSEAVVFPAENDIDPSGGGLELLDVRPNAIAGTSEYQTLAERLLEVDEDEGLVRIAAGDELGTSSFVYTVRNTNGDTAMGLIVTKVVREPVPDYPLVRDTRLTAETISQLNRGVDVLSGKVSWGTGDASTLDLNLWGNQAGFSARGWTISGEQPQQSTIVPFEVTGESFTGTEVTTYGFLRVPGEDDVQLSLRSAFESVEVNEDESVEVNLADAIIVPTGQTLEVDRDGVRASGIRPAATCEVVSGTTIRYNAGKGAPWHDSCALPVKLESQSDFTYLTLRVDVIAEDPQPVLRQGSLVVSPGDTATYDLQQMVTWEGNPDRSSLQFQLSYQGDQFEVAQSGATVTVTAADVARPGREEPATVTLTSHPDAAVGTLRITVGPAPSTLPRGATVTQMCSQAGGNTNCSIPVIGQAGEVNPLPGTPMKLRSVSSPANCEAVTFEVQNETTVQASWRSDAPGAGDCTGSFVVEDAQGRLSSGDRAGQVVLDLRGLPANPTRVEWTAYTGSSVQLSVASESSSHPAITGYRVTGAGKDLSCPASGVCSVPNLENGQQSEFQVTALNDVGESRGSARTTAWAYEAPQAPAKATELGFVPVPNGTTGGLVKAAVNVTDRTTSRLIFKAGHVTVERSVSGQGSVEAELNVGHNDPVEITVTPVTRFQPPPDRVGGGSSEGAVLRIGGAHGVGAPIIQQALTLTPNLDEGQVAVQADIAMNGSDEYRTGFAVGQNCTVDRNSTALEHTFDVPRNQEVTVTFCVRHIYQGQDFPTGSMSGSVTLRIPAPTNAFYEVGSIPEQVGNTYRWTSVTSFAEKSSPWLNLRYSVGQDGQKRSNITDIVKPGEDIGGQIYVHACDFANRCSSTLMQANGAPVLPVVDFGRLSGDICTGTLPNPDIRGDIAAGSAVLTPNEAQTSLTVSFPGWGLEAITWTCTPPPEPEPEPEPEPDPDPDPGDETPTPEP